MAGAVTASRRRHMPLESWLRRRRVARYSIAAAAIVTCCLLWAIGGIQRQLPPRWLQEAPVSVTEVREDLTLRVASADGHNQTIVRLIGVDREQLHPACHAWLREACALGPVLIEPAAADANAPGQPWPVYAYDAAGNMINERLIQDGMARADPIADHRLARWFKRLEGTARARSRGLWKD